ncbi:assembly protein [Vibrionales bacterium C3R12]|nr:assembly protein [Vibrionales bacterium C3R12]
MIYALVGRPRSGKSYESVVFHIIPAIKEGRKVITNIPVNIERLRKIFGDKADLIEVREFNFNEFGAKERPFSKPEHYMTDWRNEDNQGPLFVIDEAHLVLPRTCSVDILEYYSMHGHHGVDIVLLSQNLRKVNKDIKDMIETTHLCIKNTHLGTDKTYTKKLFLGSETKGQPVDVEEREYDKNYFGFYQSHTASKSAVVEAQAKDVKSVKDHWSVKFGRFFIIGGLLYLVGLGFYLFSGDDEEVPSVKTEYKQESGSDAQQETKAKTKSKVFGLLDDFDFYIAGWSKQLVETNGRFNSDLSFYRVYVDVYTGDEFEFSLEHTDLIKLGYAFKKLSECVYQVSYFDNVRLVTCKYREAVKDDSAVDVIKAVPSVSV